MKQTPLKPNPEKVAEFHQRARENSSLGRRDSGTDEVDARRQRRKPSFTPASKEQRAKVKRSELAIVRFLGGTVGLERTPLPYPVDPMHLTPRSKGGCDDPACVVAAARESVHNPYDEGRLSLLEFFAEPHNQAAYLKELQHMLTHLTPVEMVEQLANDRVEWRGSGGPCGR